MLTIAHRGASSVRPENTIAAFREAVREGADYIELDIRFSRDREVVVFHDHLLNRTTNGRGPVEGRTLKELKELDAGSWFSPGYSGEKIPTLCETIQTLRSSSVELYIEIKVDRGEADVQNSLVRKTLRILKREDFLDRVFIASFDGRVISIAREIMPRIRTGLIFRRDAVWGICEETGYKNIDVLCARWNTITAGRVKRARGGGKKVFAWTIDRREDLEKILPLGVDAIASNNPGWLVKTLQ